MLNPIPVTRSDLAAELRREAEARRSYDPRLALLLLGAALALEAAVRRVRTLERGMS